MKKLICLCMAVFMFVSLFGCHDKSESQLVSSEAMAESEIAPSDLSSQSSTSNKTDSHTSPNISLSSTVESTQEQEPVSSEDEWLKNPVVKGADPFILLYDGVYYHYSTSDTNNGYIINKSTDLENWRFAAHAFDKNDVKGDGDFWAPEVFYYKDKFYMIYTAKQHLGIAVSDSPTGPFKQTEKRFMNEKFREIDGHLFLDDDGTVYVYFVRSASRNVIYGAKMNDDMLTYDESTAVKLVEASEPWEKIFGNVAEGPEMLKHNGKYYLTYSANGYTSHDYAIGYAISDSPLGPFKKYEGNPILKKSDKVKGTGHHSFTTSKDGKQLLIVYHRHFTDTEVEPRYTCIDKVYFENGVLKVVGPT